MDAGARGAGSGEAESLRPGAFAIAYRMTGSVADAEDIVQEAMLRWARARREGVRIASGRAFVSTVVTRLAIDHLRAARRARERYAGPWLPEPIVAEPGPGPEERAELGDSLSMAFLVVLETLSPVERAVFLLREVFDHSYEEVAAIVGRSAVNCRQIAARARRHVDARRPRFDVPAARRDELSRRFFDALGEGDLAGLVDLLAEDVVLYGDGGGRAPALPEPLRGRGRVADVLVRLGAQARALGLRAHGGGVKGPPGGAFRVGRGRLVSVVALDVGEEGIAAVRSVVNPDKLRHLGEIADPAGLRRARHAQGVGGTSP